MSLRWTQVSPWGRKDRQSCTFTPSRCKLIKTCSITAPPMVFTRVALAKSQRQISAGGDGTRAHNWGLLFFMAWEPSAPEPAPRWMERPGGGTCSLPGQRQLIPCIARENSVLSVLIPPPFLCHWH